MQSQMEKTMEYLMEAGVKYMYGSGGYCVLSLQSGTGAP